MILLLEATGDARGQKDEFFWNISYILVLIYPKPMKGNQIDSF